MATATVTSTLSRKLTQDEIDSFYCQQFIQQILDFIRDGRTARFLVHKARYNLVEISHDLTYNMRISRENRYSYRLSDLIHFIEQLYDKDLEVIALGDEIPITCIHVQAIPDADAQAA